MMSAMSAVPRVRPPPPPPSAPADADDAFGDSGRGVRGGGRRQQDEPLGYWLDKAGPEEEEEDRGDWSEGGQEERPWGRPTTRGGGGRGGGSRDGPMPARGFKYSRERRQEEGRGPTLRETLIGEILFGVSPVLAALEANRRTVHRLLIQDTIDLANRKDAKAVERAKKMAEEKGAEVLSVSKHDLNMFTENRPHQGLALDCSGLDFLPLDEPPRVSERPGRRFPVWLALDEVTDAQNFGAVLRSAFFLGADGIMVCSKNAAPLNAFASKASAGAMEYMPVHDVWNMPKFLEQCTAQGWQVVGADAGEDAGPIQQHQ